MVPTRGLTHIALAVRNPARAALFYESVPGARAVYRSADVQLQTPGTYDVLVFERDRRRAGRRGGVAHFGFRLQRPADIARAARAVRRAGGAVIEQGEFVPGEPYLFARDPEGYTIELWFELPTQFDPRLGAPDVRVPPDDPSCVAGFEQCASAAGPKKDLVTDAAAV